MEYAGNGAVSGYRHRRYRHLDTLLAWVQFLARD